MRCVRDSPHCVPDDNIRCFPTQRLLLQELLQHPGPDCSRGLTALYGDGVSLIHTEISFRQKTVCVRGMLVIVCVDVDPVPFL